MLITGADVLLESPYYFPVLEVLHILGFALTVGTIALVDFRLLGWGLPEQTAAGLSTNLAPWTLVGIVSMLLTGPMLFVVDPDMYYLNFSFQLKMVFLTAAITFHYTAHRKTASASGSPLRTKAVACVSLALWASVIFGGIFIAFV